MVPTTVMTMHHVLILMVASHALVTKAMKVLVTSVPTSTSVLPNMPIKTTVDQTLIARIPLRVIFVLAHLASTVYQLIKKMVVKILTNVIPTETITVTSGPLALMKYHFTAVNVTSQVTTVMASSASMLMNVMLLTVVTTVPMVPTVSVIMLTVDISALVLMVITQPAMMIPFVLTSTNALMEHTTATLMPPVLTLMVVSNVHVRKVSLAKATTVTSNKVVLISTNVQ